MTKQAQAAITAAKTQMKSDGWLTVQTQAAAKGGAQFWAEGRGGSTVKVHADAQGEITTTKA